ncbi:hypothetical protein PL81_31705 [Streptomyces sp. RSD-27]|nr:hypothetical protein PL81_31705 [Streptomyces sp. RSD-27]
MVWWVRPALSGDADGDILDAYLAERAVRCERAVFEAVVAATRDTCAMLSEGRAAVLAGPEGSAFGPVLQREYLALPAVLMTGRTDWEVVTVPTAGGEGWAVVDPRSPPTRLQQERSAPASRPPRPTAGAWTYSRPRSRPHPDAGPRPQNTAISGLHVDWEAWSCRGWR